MSILYQAKQKIHTVHSYFAYRQYAAQAGDSLAQLAAFKDIHRGERCFIIGNGPSLKKTDLSRLRHEFTFGQLCERNLLCILFLMSEGIYGHELLDFVICGLFVPTPNNDVL